MQLSSTDLTWSGSPVTISTASVDASDAHLGMDSSANTVAVWIESGVVKSSALPLGGSWTAPTSVSTGSDSSDPQLVVDPSGNATAIWVQSGAINTATKPFGGSWGSVTTLDASGASAPQIAVRNNGDVVAVWVDSGAINSKVRLSGGSWQVLADTLSGSDADSPQVAVSDDGTIVAVWHSHNGVTSVENIFAATKAMGGLLWSTGTMVSDPAVNSVNPQVAVDTEGNATAIWFTYDLSGLAYSNVFLYTSVLPSGNSWSTPVAISSEPARFNPANLTSSILYGPVGFPFAVWTASYDGSNFFVEASQNVDNAGWSEVSTIANDIHAIDIDICVTSNNDAYAVLMSFDGSSFVNIQSMDSHVGGAQGGFWFNPTTISTDESNAFPEIVAVLTGGTTSNAVALWHNFDGSNNIIQAVTGTGTLVAPPTALGVSQNVSDFGVFQEYFNTITWTDSTDPDIVAYTIYRNNVMITSVGAGTNSFDDNNQVQNGAVTYGVSALSSSGSESAVATVSFP